MIYLKGAVLSAVDLVLVIPLWLSAFRKSLIPTGHTPVVNHAGELTCDGSEAKEFTPG